jgi:hypothetical protein
MTKKSQKINKLRIFPNDTLPAFRGDIRLSSEDDIIRTVRGNYLEFNPNETYPQDSKVIYNGRLYQALEQTLGGDPITNPSWQVFQGELQQIITNVGLFGQSLFNKTIINPQLVGSVFGLKQDLDSNSETTIPSSSAIKNFVDSNIIGNPNKLGQISDVNISGEPTEDQFLIFNSTSSTWELNQNSNTIEPTLVTVDNLDNDTTSDISGFVFNKTSNITSTYYYTIYRTGGATEIVETGEINIAQFPTSGNLLITKNNINGDASVTLSINSTTGQVQYTTSNFDTLGYFCEMEIRLLRDVPLV